MLLFKIVFGLTIFKPVWFPFVLDYGNEYCTKEKKKFNWFEIF